MIWTMQYRTRKHTMDAWGEWNNLPEHLIFSNIYLPSEFEFRAILFDAQFQFDSPPVKVYENVNG